MAMAYIGLGSNLGKRQAALRLAIEKLDKIPGCRVASVANFRETAPEGCPPGSPPFMNSVAAVQTELPPRELLGHLLGIERRMGRDRTNEARNGPRIIDMDLLLLGDEVVKAPDLELPHPRMWKRRFVLEPLTEIAPDLKDPVSGRTVREVLATLAD